MKIPTFKMHGSKARMRNWVIEHFPNTIVNYAEPFVGRGNILFGVLTAYAPEHVVVNDKFMIHFLSALYEYRGDFSFIPDDPITRQVYEQWNSAPSSLERDIVECCLAYNGNIFGAGANITENSKNRHSKSHTIARLKQAAFLLARERIWFENQDWQEFLDILGTEEEEEWFVYLDPPYYGTQTFYPNIDHIQLCSMLNQAPYKWALSGYPNDVYAEHLNYTRMFTKERASVAKANNGQSGTELTKIECLWVNY